MFTIYNFNGIQFKNGTFLVCFFLSGGVSVGVPKKCSAASTSATNTAADAGKGVAQGDIPGTSSSSNAQRKRSSPPPPPPAKKSRRVCPDLHETEETKDMTTPELQRLVLLEQLKLIRMQQKQINQ